VLSVILGAVRNIDRGKIKIIFTTLQVGEPVDQRAVAPLAHLCTCQIVTSISWTLNIVFPGARDMTPRANESDLRAP
jgi:hypothetical protein